MKVKYWFYTTVSMKEKYDFDCAINLYTSRGWELVESSFQTMAAEHNLMYSALVKKQETKEVQVDRPESFVDQLGTVKGL